MWPWFVPPGMTVQCSTYVGLLPVFWVTSCFPIIRVRERRCDQTYTQSGWPVSSMDSEAEIKPDIINCFV